MNIQQIKNFLEEQENFLSHMNREMVEDEHVVKGEIDDSHRLKKCGETKEPKSKRRRME